MNEYIPVIVISVVMGTIARLNLLKADYRQYPSYPQGYISHLTLGLIAASLGAVAIPAIIEKDFAAVTFLSLAATQFRDIRNMERESLKNMEETELVPRGKAYIEDIAKAFESRNYISLITSLSTSLFLQLYSSIMDSDVKVYTQMIIGAIIGIITIIVLNYFSKVKVIGDIAEVQPAKIKFKGPLLCVENIVIMNVGFRESQKIILEKAMGVMIVPKDD